MADLTITAASVASLGSASQRTTGVCGSSSITQGMPLYIASGTLLPAANTSVAAAAAVGIALNAASPGQYVTYQTEGDINLGATLVVGMAYHVSAAGLISPVTDATTADFNTYLGTARTAAILELQPHAAPVALAADIT